MTLTQRWAGGEQPTATKWNETSLPVVSTTADISSPYAGQLVFATSDTRLWRYTGSTWAVFSSGPICSVTHSVVQAINNNVYTAQLFDTDLTDTDLMHSTSSNTDRITVVKAGLYMVIPKAHYIANATNQRACKLTLNGVDVAGSVTVANNCGTQGTSILGPTQLLQLAVNDILRMLVWQNSGGALNTEAGSPLFTAMWLRD